MTSPAVATVVVAYDSAQDLPRTLASVRAQMRPGDELLVVDNASADGSAAVARAAGAEVLSLDANRGFAGGANAGARATRAPLLLLLNPDARLEPGCLDALRAIAATRPAWGAWQAVVLHADGATINSAGNVTHWLGFGWAGLCDEPASAAGTEPREASFASGAALMARRAAWEAIGGFEEKFFMYVEDLDLGLRLRLAGWGCGVVPAARVIHEYTFAKGDYKWFHLERNRWWTVLGAYPSLLLALVAPALLAFEVALLAVAARQGWLRPKLRAQAAAVRTLPWALRRRARVQAGRRIATVAFADALTASLDSPYLSGAGAAEPLVRAQAAYWRIVCALLRRAPDA